MRALGFAGMAVWVGLIVAACSGGSSDGLVTSSDGGGGGDANPPGCPSAKPASLGACAPTGLTCSYGCNVTATCRGGVWSVVESNIACPSDGGADRLPDGAILCSTDEDCRAAQGFLTCSPGGATVGCGICARPENPCSEDSDCALIDDAAPPKPMVCGPGGPCVCPAGGKSGSCIPACQGPSDCPPQEACSSGHCVPKPCTTDAECPSTSTQDYACGASHTCAPKACTTDADCGGHYCVDKICYPERGICTPPAA